MTAPDEFMTITGLSKVPISDPPYCVVTSRTISDVPSRTNTAAAVLDQAPKYDEASAHEPGSSTRSLTASFINASTTQYMDVVLLLIMCDGQFYGFDGVFEVRDSAIVLPKAGPSDGDQFKGMPVDRFIARVLTIKNGR